MIAKQQLTFPGSITMSKRSVNNSPIPEIAKLRRTYVLAVLDVPNSRKRMEPAINEVWRRLKQPSKAPGWVSVYRWKARFLQSKNDIRALVEIHPAKATEQAASAQCHEPLPRSHLGKYLRRERDTIQQTLEDAMLRIMKENGLRPESDKLPMPTRRFIARLIADIPEFEKYSARYGPDAARKMFRLVKGHRLVSAPLERAEIDHTRLDIFVVDDKTSLPLGRPYVTACIDSYTRCILGISVGFIPPSYQSVATCLKDCFRPKVNLRNRVSRDRQRMACIRRNAPTRGGRRPEFYSTSLEHLCLSLGIEWCAAPRREPMV